MSLRIDLTGQKFNKLTVCEEWYNSDTKYWMAFCECECGNTTDVRKINLVSGHTKSCGCLQREKVIEANIKHGELSNGRDSKEYRTLENMIQRCYNLNNSQFKNYGGRGIKICQRWLDSFENFLEDMDRAPGIEYSIDRIDNDGDYCKENCKWATPKEQLQNTRRNVWLECDGIKMIKTGWMRELSISHKFIDDRLKKNIPFSEIVKQAREHVLKKAIRHWGEDLRQDDFENGYGVQI